MNLREEILREHSKAHSQMIAAWIGDDTNRFTELLSLFLYDEYRVVQRAAWVVSMVAGRAPEIVAPHLPGMIARMLEEDLPTAVPRNVLRILQDVNIPEGQHGILMDACFRFASDPKEAIAIRAFSLNILAKLVVIYPKISEELTAVIESGMEREPTPAFRSCAKRALKAIGKR